MKGKWFVATSVGVIMAVCLFNWLSPLLNSFTEESLTSSGGSEVVLEKTNSPGFYKVYNDYVVELWDDGTVAESYPIKGTFHSISDFRGSMEGYSLNNPLKYLDLSSIKNIILFGPINEDFDDRIGVEYQVFGLLVETGSGIDYYMNSLGKSKVFTYIQNLRIK